MCERFSAEARLRSSQLVVTYSSHSGNTEDPFYRRRDVFLRNHVCQRGRFGILAAIRERGFENSRLSRVCVSRTIGVLGTGCFANSRISRLVFENPFGFSTIAAFAFEFARLPKLFSFPIDIDPKSISFAGESQVVSELSMNQRQGIAIRRRASMYRAFALSGDWDLSGELGMSGAEGIIEQFIQGLGTEVLFPSSGLTDEAGARAVLCVGIFCWTFACCGSLEEICIPSFVEVLCEGSFESCNRLRIVWFEPNSKLTRIGRKAFSKCASLESICLPSAVEVLSRSAFASCSSLHRVTFGCKSIVWDCPEFSSSGVPVDSQLREIEAYAFGSCSSLRSLFITSVVDRIDWDAFVSSGISEVIVASDNPHFKVRGQFLLSGDGTSVIRYFGRDSEVEVFREIRTLGTFSFGGCSDLRNVTFERKSELRRIEYAAFFHCSSLQSLFIPSFVDTIDADAFGWTRIPEIVVAGDNRHFKGRGPFLLNHDGTSLIHCFGRDSTIELFREITVLCEKSFSDLAGLREVSFESHSQLRRIESFAFFDCSSLQWIFIPSLVDTIGVDAFIGSGIREIIVADDNPHFKVCDPFLLNYDGTSLILCFREDSHVEVFRESTVLSEKSFSGLVALRRVSFESHSQLRRIESLAFSDCSSLQSIFIPSFVDTIDEFAFRDSGIREIIVADDNPNFKGRGPFLLNHEGTSLIRYFGSDSSVELFREITILCHFAFSGGSRLREVSFESGSRLRRIDPFAFSDCALLQSFFIPSFVDTIDGSAFAYSGIRQIIVAADNPYFKICGPFLLNHNGTSLVRYFGLDSTVKIGSQVEVLLPNSMADCTDLTEVEFESGSRLGRIQHWAFARCRSLGHISLPSSTQVLEYHCFADCGNLREVRFGPGSRLRRIEADAFRDCHSLESILLPMSLRSNDVVDLSGATGFDLVWYDDKGSVDEFTA
jgi:hypothetical protein